MIKCGRCGNEEVMSVTLEPGTDPEFRCDKCFEPADSRLSVYDLLKRLERASARARAKQIDANTCGTRSDFQEADEAEAMRDCVSISVEREIEKRIRASAAGLEERNRNLERTNADLGARLRKIKLAMEG